jgi:polyhydroxybutyrate depolymerase
MKKTLSLLMVILLVMSTFSTAFAADPTTQETGIQQGVITVDGLDRTYKYYVPSTYNGKKKVPLMLSFHGRGSNSLEQIGLTGYEKVAEKEGFIVVFPDSTQIEDVPVSSGGHKRQWNDGRPDTPSYIRGIDDVKFTSQLIDLFAANYNIDLSSVYATGMSNGSIFSNRLAVELSDRIAGIGAVTGPLANNISAQVPKSPVTVVLVMGDTDPIVPFNGAPGYLFSADQTIKYWIQHNKTVKKPRVTYLPQTVTGDPTKIRRDVYSGGKYGTEVILYTVEGGGHTWPGGPQYLHPIFIGLASQQMNASEVIWNELKTHKLKVNNGSNK